jgi:hypothetical protein
MTGLQQSACQNAKNPENPPFSAMGGCVDLGILAKAWENVPIFRHGKSGQSRSAIHRPIRRLSGRHGAGQSRRTLRRPVLVIGERGTGKELIAERLHRLSRAGTSR